MYEKTKKEFLVCGTPVTNVYKFLGHFLNIKNMKKEKLKDKNKRAISNLSYIIL